jgi:flagellar basal-body rod modification protein FlgD
MQVTAAAATGNNQKTSTTGSKQQIDSTEFMTLLVTQLQNQDPMNPMDQQAFMGELAQIQSVSELQKIGDTLTSIKTQLAGTTKTSATT